MPKSDKETSRFIWDGSHFDMLFKRAVGKPPAMPLLHMRDVIRRLLYGWSHVSAADFKSFFFQFGLQLTDPSVLGFYMRGAPHTALAMTVLPMGVCFAPASGEHVACYLVEVLHHRLQHHHLRFDIVVWVDNLIVLTNNQHDDELIRDAADALFGEVNLQIKDGWKIGDKDGTQLEGLGLQIDLRQALIKPAQASVDNLREAEQKFYNEPTPSRFFHLVGNVIWFSFVGTRPLCIVPDFMDVVRSQSRRALQGTQQWHQADATTYDDNLRGVLRQAINYVRQAQVRGRQHQPVPEREIFTDASTTAIAGISDTDDLFVLPVRAQPHTMQSAELLAGLMASFYFEPDRGCGRSTTQSRTSRSSRGTRRHR